MSAEWWRAYRAKRREAIRAQDRERNRRRRANGREDRTTEYRNRPSRAVPPLPVLFPEIRRGQGVSFWEDELRMDLQQEAALAVCEGRDPEDAVALYRSREMAWRSMTVSLFD
jgi:hypothetical protein